MTIKINSFNAHRDLQFFAVHEICSCKRRGLSINGFAYAEDLSPAGARISLFVPAGTERAELEQAIVKAYADRDVVAHEVMVCPVDWFTEADVMAKESHSVEVADARY